MLIKYDREYFLRKVQDDEDRSVYAKQQEVESWVDALMTGTLIDKALAIFRSERDEYLKSKLANAPWDGIRIHLINIKANANPDIIQQIETTQAHNPVFQAYMMLVTHYRNNNHIELLYYDIVRSHLVPEVIVKYREEFFEESYGSYRTQLRDLRTGPNAETIQRALKFGIEQIFCVLTSPRNASIGIDGELEGIISREKNELTFQLSVADLRIVNRSLSIFAHVVFPPIIAWCYMNSHLVRVNRLGVVKSNLPAHLPVEFLRDYHSVKILSILKMYEYLGELGALIPDCNPILNLSRFFIYVLNFNERDRLKIFNQEDLLFLFSEIQKAEDDPRLDWLSFDKLSSVIKLVIALNTFHIPMNWQQFRNRLGTNGEKSKVFAVVYFSATLSSLPDVSEKMISFFIIFLNLTFADIARNETSVNLYGVGGVINAVLNTSQNKSADAAELSSFVDSLSVDFLAETLGSILSKLPNDHNPDHEAARNQHYLDLALAFKASFKAHCSQIITAELVPPADVNLPIANPPAHLRRRF